MRKSDKQIIMQAIEILGGVCARYEKGCMDCPLYQGKCCLMDVPPDKLDSEKIIEVLDKVRV